jgi:hypothetical protein
MVAKLIRQESIADKQDGQGFGLRLFGISADKESMESNQTPQPTFTTKQVFAAIALAALGFSGLLAQGVAFVVALVTGTPLVCALLLGVYLLAALARRIFRPQQVAFSNGVRRTPKRYQACYYAIYFGAFALSLEMAGAGIAIAMFGWPLVAISIIVQLIPSLPVKANAKASAES